MPDRATGRSPQDERDDHDSQGQNKRRTPSSANATVPLVEFLRSCRTTTQVSVFRLLFAIPGSHPTFDRSVVWTSLAILFAHETEPAIVGRAFPSSRQFRLQSPAVIANSPGSYEPPTVLCVSPSEDWLFAYFPGRQAPGLGCFWRAQQADGWDVIEPISFALSRGVVSAKWLGHAREVWPESMMPSKHSLTCATVGCRFRPEYLEASPTWTRCVGVLAYTCTSHAEPPGTGL